MTKYTITIPQPCTEDCEQMTPADKGRYCANCQKTVIDFTGLTDEAVFNVFKSGTAVCGRFSGSQLSREMTTPPPPPSALASWAGRIAAAILLLQSTVGNAFAQSKPKAEITNTGSKHTARHSDLQVTGRVMDYATGQPLAGIQVYIYGTTDSVITTPDGYFALPVPGHLYLQTIIIRAVDSFQFPLPPNNVASQYGYVTEGESVKVDDKLPNTNLILYRYPAEQLPVQDYVVDKSEPHLPNNIVLSGLFITEQQSTKNKRKFSLRNLFKHKSVKNTPHE